MRNELCGKKSLLLKAVEQNLPCDTAGIQNARGCQRVTYLCPLPFSMDEPLLTQDGEMLADLGLALACGLDQFFDQSWPLSKQMEQFQSGRVSQDLAKLRLQLIQLPFLFDLYALHVPIPCYIQVFILSNTLT
jgi:hypothetical protein